MPEVTQRSTGNRRAVRNALFRSLMSDEHRRAVRKLREYDLMRQQAELDRFDRTIMGPVGMPGDIVYVKPHLNIVTGPPLRVNPLLEVHGIVSVSEPPPHPLVRLWRRLVWGE